MWISFEIQPLSVVSVCVHRLGPDSTEGGENTRTPPKVHHQLILHFVRCESASYIPKLLEILTEIHSQQRMSSKIGTQTQKVSQTRSAKRRRLLKRSCETPLFQDSLSLKREKIINRMQTHKKHKRLKQAQKHK